jgi:hypothetical protein
MLKFQVPSMQPFDALILDIVYLLSLLSYLTTYCIYSTTLYTLLYHNNDIFTLPVITIKLLQPHNNDTPTPAKHTS